MKFWRFVFISILFVSLVFLIAACGGDSAEEIATINGKPVTETQFDAYLKFKRVDPNKEKMAASVLDRYLERKALADAIEGQDLLDQELLKAELEDFRSQMYISRYFEAFLKDRVTDQAVRNYYNAHSEDYQEEKAHVAHLLIRTNPKMTEPERKAKLTAAREAFSKIKKGEEFAKVAEQYSEDRVSAKKGGDLGWIRKGSIGKSFSDTVFGMKEGEVAEPFETSFGFHVVKLMEGPKTVKRPFDAVAGDIRYQLRAEAKEAEIDRLMSAVEIERK